MKLSQKIALSFVVVIVVFGSICGFATSQLLDLRMRHEIATSEVLFARSLATRIFKHVRDRDAIQVTDVLFDEHQLRAEKLEYLLVTDAKGKILAHTFLRPIPADINVVTGPWPAGKGQNIQVIESPTIFVTDVAVPIFEGIVPIGSVHVGLRGEYLEALKTDVKRLTLAATLAVGLLATVIALVLTCLLYTSPSPRDRQKSRMPSSA